MEDIILASLLRSAVSKMTKRLRKQMHTANSLSMTELHTLSHLFPGNAMFPSNLAGLEMVKTQSMSEVLNKLEALQLIHKTPSTTDKRKTLVSITDAGKQMVQQTRYERDEWLKNAIEHHLSASEKEILKNAIELMEKLNDFK